MSSNILNEETYNFTYLITKENFRLTFYCKNKDKFKTLLEESFFHSLKEIVKMFRKFFNSAKENHSRLIFVIDLMTKYIKLLNKLQSQSLDGLMDATLINNGFINNTNDLSKILDSLVNVLSNDLIYNKINGLEKVINLFYSDITTNKNLNEEMKIIFAEASKSVSKFVNDILLSKISLESENLIMNYFIQIFINKLKEVIEKNLKHKNSKFSNELRVSAEKTYEFLYQIRTNKKLNHSTQAILEKTIENLQIYFNMFSISN